MSRKIKSINVTPTWSALLPTLLAFTRERKPSVQKAGYAELTRMAQAADKWNEYCTATTSTRPVRAKHTRKVRK